MNIFIKSRDDCIRMTFEEFQQKALNHVRNENHMGLIDSWERHIVFKSFFQICAEASVSCTPSYYGGVCFAEETCKKELSVKLYSFSYHEAYENNNSAIFYCIDGLLYKEDIDAIAKLSSCYNRNKNRFFEGTLDEYQQEKKIGRHGTARKL